MNDIITFMEKTILIAGKEYPEGSELASGAVLQGNTVVITSNPVVTEIKPEEGVTTVNWNKISALSSRSLIISALNVNGHLDEAVLVFDEEFLAPKYGNPGASESNRAFDELILSYQFLTTELLLRYNQRKNAGLESKPGKIVFVYKSNMSEAQVVANPGLRTGSRTLSKSLVAAAGAAFKAFAENMAASVCETDDVIPVLVECDPQNETARKDSTLMKWLCEYLDQIDNLKKTLTPKQKVSWVKAGTKSPGGFGLFR